MKCPDCRLCLDVYTIFVDGNNKLFYRCDLCGNVYRNMRGNPILLGEEDSNIIDILENRNEDKLETSRKLY